MRGSWGIRGLGIRTRKTTRMMIIIMATIVIGIMIIRTMIIMIKIMKTLDWRLRRQLARRRLRISG